MTVDDTQLQGGITYCVPTTWRDETQNGHGAYYAELIDRLDVDLEKTIRFGKQKSTAQPWQCHGSHFARCLPLLNWLNQATNSLNIHHLPDLAACGFWVEWVGWPNESN